MHLLVQEMYDKYLNVSMHGVYNPGEATFRTPCIVYIANEMCSHNTTHFHNGTLPVTEEPTTLLYRRGNLNVIPCLSPYPT